MTRSRLLIFTLLALAPGCSAKNSAPGSADKNAMTAPDAAAPEPAPRDGEAAAAPAAAEPLEEERELDEVEAEGEPARDKASRAEASLAKDDALAGSRLEIAEPMINGGLNRDIIRRKAQDHEDQIRACHARSLVGDPDLGGTVALELSVDERGVVKNVELADATDLADEDTVDCILELVSGWSFAGEATGKASVELRFDLTAAD